MEQIKQKLTQLSKQLDDITGKLNINKKRKTIEILQGKTTLPDFWSDESKAKKILKDLSSTQEEINQIDSLNQGLKDALELVNLSLVNHDLELIAELQNEAKSFQKRLSQLEIKLFLSGDHDADNSLLSIHSGQGGTEAQDWAEMLKRMYLRYFDKSNWKYDVIHESRGEEAGIKSVTILVKGQFAYGYLKHEKGTHRLVRLSPFNADNLRQTSFALVEVLPEIQDDKEVEINESDLEWKFFRSSGKGGQNVNKVSTAVRLKHLPSGITVESQAERTQVQNRNLALSILKSRLWDKKQAESEKKRLDIKGQHHPATFGSQIRSYILHPYKLVKDNRTQLEITEAESVLDGFLDPFIEAEIRQLANV